MREEHDMDSIDGSTSKETVSMDTTGFLVGGSSVLAGVSIVHVRESSAIAGGSGERFEEPFDIVGASCAIAGGTGVTAVNGKLRGYEPYNCNRLTRSIESDPWREARRFINEDRKRNCCSVGADNSVQRWQLTRGKDKVLVKVADIGTTFCHSDDLPLDHS